MTLTASQIRQARALLGWTSPRLSRTSKVGFDKVLKAQGDETIIMLSFMDVWDIRAALEKAGVHFGLDAEGRPSAVLARAL